MSPAPVPPLWVLPSIQVLHGLTAITRWRIPSIFAVGYGLYCLAFYLLHHPAGDHLETMIFGYQLIAHVWTTCNDLLFREAQDFTRVATGPKAEKSEKDQSNRRNKRRTRSVGQLLLDVFEIGFLTTRGIGWKFQRKTISHAKPSSYSRKKFVAENLYGATWRFIAVDIASIYIRSTPHGTQPIQGRLQDEPLPIGLFRALLLYSMCLMALDMLYRIVAAGAVGVGLYDPSVWPPLFGSVRDAYTVRRFWSHTWHQMMRNVSEPSVNFLVRKVFCIPPRTYLSNYLKVFGAFFVASVFHGYGSQIAGSSYVNDWNYFMAQVGAIWFEETIITVALRLGIPKDFILAKPIGYLWTALFTAYTLMFWQDYNVVKGAYTKSPFGFSIVEMLISMK